jgi:predicted glycoside hydrolase/deacetylase ChbG (UPF0249 family)
LGLHFSITTHIDKGSYSSFLLRYLVGAVSENTIKSELESQYFKLREKNLEISFLDAHQNIQLLKKIFNPLETFADEHGLFLRKPFEVSPFRNTKKYIYNSLAKSPNDLPLIGLSMMGSNLNLKNLEQQIQYLNDLGVERVLWMVHPAKGGVSNDDSIGLGRLLEYEFLKKESAFINDHFDLLPLKSTLES